MLCQRQGRPVATIKDIVRETGFGLGTVSRALNNSSRVKPETRRIILETARRLGFVPNQAARALASREGEIPRIGIVAPHLTSPFYSEVIRGIYTRLRGERVRLTLHAVFEDEQKEAELNRILEEGSEQRLLLISIAVPDESKALLEERGTEVVLIDTPDADLPFVAVDNQYGAHLGTQHLLRGQYTSYAFLGDAYRSRQALDRERGFLEAMQEANINPARYRIRTCNIVEQELDAILEELLGGPDRPGALFCFSDLMAYRALEFCARWGIQPGRDLALLGYDDLPFSRYLNLSSVAQPLQQLGTVGASLLIDADNARPHQQWLRPHLELRGTG